MAVGTLPVAAIAETAQATSVETQASTTPVVKDIQEGDVTFTYHGKEYTSTTDSSKGSDRVSIAETDYNIDDDQVTLESVGGLSFKKIGDAANNYFEVYDGDTYLGHAQATFTVNTDIDNTYNGTLYIEFSLNGYGYLSRTVQLVVGTRSLSGITFEKVDNTGNRVTALGTDAVYNGRYQTFALFYNGLRVDANQVRITSTPQSSSAQIDPNGVVTVKDAGKYTFDIEGLGDAYGSKTGQITLEVKKLDLSNADVEANDYDGYFDADKLIINGVAVANTDLSGQIKVTPADTGAVDDHGPHTIKVEADTANIEGDTTVTTNRVTSLATIEYDGNPVYDGNSDQDTDSFYKSIYHFDAWVDLDDADNFDIFDSSKVKAVDNGGHALAYTITYTDLATGQEVDENTVRTKTGHYKVTVETTYDANYTQGAKAVFHIQNVRRGNYDVSVKFDGNYVQPGLAGFAEYDGTTKQPEVTVTKQDKNGKDITLTEGTDYEVHIYKTDKFKGAQGAEVDGITDAGWYEIVVTGKDGQNLGYDDRVTYIHIDPMYVVAQLSTDNQKNYGSGYYFAYTGSEIEPKFEFFHLDSDGDYVYDGTSIVAVSSLTEKEYDAAISTYGDWRYSKIDVPADAYTVTYSQTVNGKKQSVDSVVERGNYEADLNDAKPDDEDNYAISWTAWNKITVSAARRFSDVANDAWYYKVINDAADAGYIHGYDKTDLFGPEDQITRGQVACILYNVATQDGKVDETLLHYDSQKGYQTSFSDVDGNAYYAKAVAWAAQAGVVHGYGDGTFRADQNVTREEFAAMLANYASKVDGYEAGSASDLESFADAGQVSDWAKDVVAWAVHNKIMGNGGFIAPQANITRAETAAMVMNWVNIRK